MTLIPRNPVTQAWCWTILILLLLSIPGGVARVSTFFQADKVVHFALFLVLAFLWLRVPWNSDLARAWAIIGAGVVFSVLSELYQGIIPIDRTPDVFDVVADVLGFFAGAALWHFLKPGRQIETTG